MTTENLTRASLTLDLTGGTIRTGGKGPIPPGYYEVSIRECGVYSAASGSQSVKFVAEVTGGEHAGSTAWVFIGLDTSKDGIKNIWQTALVSMGYDSAAVNAALTIDTDMFIGRPAYLRVTPQRDDATKFNRTLITREEYTYGVTKASTEPVAMTVQTVPQQRVATATVSVPTMTIAAPTVPQPTVSAAKLATFATR